MTQAELDFSSPTNDVLVFTHPLFADIAPHIVRAFWEFHCENPHIYKLFEKFAREAKQKGRQRFGARMIVERIRWYTAVETTDRDFKINDHHSSCYSRLLEAEHPQEFAHFFANRKSQ